MKALPPLLVIVSCAQLGAYSAEPAPLPAPAEFTPSRYLGKWFEVARLPTAMQPKGSLATAEYAADEPDGTIIITNTAYDARGNVTQVIAGRAQRAEGETKGRLRVSFGPVLPEEPNYCVLHVDRNYRVAVVGSPDRGSLWILSRNVPIAEKRLRRLTRIAERAGYDTTKLDVAAWPERFADGGAGKDRTPDSALSGAWTLHVGGPDGEVVDLPMELHVAGGKLTGRIGRRDGRWMAIEDGTIDGEAFSFTVERDRPNGGSMTYTMAGRLADGRLAGTVRTEIADRGDITAEWDADPRPEAK